MANRIHTRSDVSSYSNETQKFTGHCQLKQVDTRSKHYFYLVFMFILLIPASIVHAYDLKQFAGFGGGSSYLDNTLTGFEQTDKSGSFMSLNHGFDLTRRISLEFRRGHVDGFRYESLNSPGYDGNESAPSYTISMNLYLWGSQGMTGVYHRLGINMYIDVGATYFNGEVIYSNIDSEPFKEDVRGTHVHVGIGFEYGFQNPTFIRLYVGNVGDLFNHATINIGWRWGRND